MKEEKKTPLEHDVHKYERVKLGSKGYRVYKCMLPNCMHYVREELVIGMLTICHRCGQPVQMTKLMAQQKKPHCRMCTRPYVRHGGESAA
jgi:hypothetical protein